MSIILTISICLNVFQFIIFILLVLAYKSTIDNYKKIDKEMDEFIDMLKEKLHNEDHD